MTTLVCDLCGGKLVMGAGGVATCDSCGMEYSVDRMKEKVQEIKGTIRVDNSHMLDTYIGMMDTAIEAENYPEAENYANKVIEISPHSAKAWFCKGKAAGWQTTGANNRFAESIVNWINAIDYASEEERKSLEEEIKIEAGELSLAIIKMHCSNFEEFRSEENKKLIIDTIEMLEYQLSVLKERAGIDILSDHGIMNLIAAKVSNCAANGAANAKNSFGPNLSDKTEFFWRQYTAALDRCLELLEKAYEYQMDDDFCSKICEWFVLIGESVRDSCSYTMEYNPYTDQIQYSKEYSFTVETKRIRNKKIEEWKGKRSLHDAEKRKVKCEQAISQYDDYCGHKRREFAKEKYWAEHQEEKRALESELKEIEEKKNQLKLELDSNEDYKNIQKISSEITIATVKMSSLGLFKGKEKKALAQRIEELKNERRNCEKKWNGVRTKLDIAIKSIEQRISEIKNEMTKDREEVPLPAKRQINLFSSDKVSMIDLLTYHKAVLPDGYSICGDGENTIEKCVDEGNDESNVYVIRFSVNNNDSGIRMWSLSKDIDDGIERLLVYEIAEVTKSVRDVANFMAVVLSSVGGYCAELNRNGLDRKIAEVAYGLSPTISIKSGNLLCKISGGTKETLSFTIMPYVMS